MIENKIIYPFKFPSLLPVPIKTKGLSWWKKIYVWITSRREWILTEDWFYVTAEGTIIFVPKGFIFDGASIPRMFWWFLSPTGLLLIPSIIHDFIYRNGFYYDATVKDNFVTVSCTRSTADKMLYDIAYEVNEIHFADVIAYGAVKLFGWSAWNKNKKERIKEVEELKKNAG